MENKLPATLRKMTLVNVRPADPDRPDTGFLATVTLDAFMLPDAFEKAGFVFQGEPIDITAFLTVRPAHGAPVTDTKRCYLLADKPKLWKE